jgi:hypothetical protein
MPPWFCDCTRLSPFAGTRHEITPGPDYKKLFSKASLVELEEAWRTAGSRWMPSAILSRPLHYPLEQLETLAS